MTLQANRLKLDFVNPPSGIVSVPGFSAEFSGEDWNQLESRHARVVSPLEQATVRGKEHLYYEPNSKAIILRPNLEPLHMPELEESTVDFAYKWEQDPNTREFRWWKEAVKGWRGDDWELGGEGAQWQHENVYGNPRRRVWYQSAVEYRPEGEPERKAVQWWLHAGRRWAPRRRYGAGEGYFRENQGFTCWLARNNLPRGEENKLSFHLFTMDERDEPTNGIIIEITGGREAKVGHYVTLDSVSSWPPRKVQRTQWESVTLPTNEPIYDWEGDPVVYSVFMVGRFIILSVNGLTNTVAIPVRNYHTGEDQTGRKYPVIMPAGASLYIEGRGQAMLGMKSSHYEAEGEAETPLVYPGYQLNEPEVKVTQSRLHGGEITKLGLGDGKEKIGGVVEEGPLSDSDENMGYYARIGLKSPVIDTREEYYGRVTPTTPEVYRTRIYDKRFRVTAPLPSREPVENDILSYRESASVSVTDGWGNSSFDIKVIGVEDEYPSLVSAKMPLSKIYFAHRGSEEESEPVLQAVAILSQPSISIKNSGDISIDLVGADITSRLDQMPIMENLSFDDWQYTDIELIQELAGMAGFNIELGDIEGKDLPSAPVGREPIWQFSPGTSIWYAMKQVVNISGRVLYPKRGELNTLVYDRYPRADDDADWVFNRKTSPVGWLKYGVKNRWKTRIYVVGRAGEDTEEYREGDKLVGVWKSKDAEEAIGWDLPHIEVNDNLTTWAGVQAHGDKLDRDFNGENVSVSFDLQDARDYMSLYPYQVFVWEDEKHPDLHGKKFMVLSRSFHADGFEVTGHVQGVILS